MVKEQLESQARILQKEYEDIILRIADSGYANLESELAGLMRRLRGWVPARHGWGETADRLKEWKQQDVTPNQTIWDIDKFADGSISEGELERLKESFWTFRKN